MARRRRKLRISIVGAGSVGTALAVALHRRGHVIVSAISFHLASARRCAKLVGCRNFSSELSSLAQDQDLILISTPEDAIKRVVHQLWRLNIRFNGTYVMHTSGIYSDEVLRSLKARGAKTFCLHPIQTFPANMSAAHHLRSLAGITYGFTGESSSVSFARDLVRSLKGKMVRVPKEAKILYHLACVFASNYSVALLGSVEKLAGRFSKRTRVSDFKELLTSSVSNALVLGPSKALTGPIARGSVETVRRHLNELGMKQKDLIPLYKTLGLQALELASKQRRLSGEQIKQLKNLLKR